MTRYLINSNPEKGDGVKEGVKDKTNSRDASASKNCLLFLCAKYRMGKRTHFDRVPHICCIVKYCTKIYRSNREY